MGQDSVGGRWAAEAARHLLEDVRDDRLEKAGMQPRSLERARMDVDFRLKGRELTVKLEAESGERWDLSVPISELGPANDFAKLRLKIALETFDWQQSESKRTALLEVRLSSDPIVGLLFGDELKDLASAFGGARTVEVRG